MRRSPGAPVSTGDAPFTPSPYRRQASGDIAIGLGPVSMNARLTSTNLSCGEGRRELVPEQSYSTSVIVTDPHGRARGAPEFAMPRFSMSGVVISRGELNRP